LTHGGFTECNVVEEKLREFPHWKLMEIYMLEIFHVGLTALFGQELEGSEVHEIRKK